jgi:UDP-glucose 4-epimerase
MRILVTGVGGLVGSWVAEGLVQQGHQVLGIDDLSGGTLENAQIPGRGQGANNYRFQQIDINDEARMKDLIMGTAPEIVFHAAACAREGASAFQPNKIVKTNILATVSLLERCLQNGLKKWVQCSSMAVAGNNKTPFTEEQRRNPVDVYGSNKAATEEIIESLAAVHKFHYTILRPHNVVGERQSLVDPYRNFVGITMNRIMRREPLYLYGEGHVRAFSYIEDSLPAFLKACDLKTANGEIIYVGGKEPILVEDMLKAIIEEFPDIKKPEIVKLDARPLEVKEAWCSTTKSEKLLGYKEEIGWREGVRRMAAWAKEKGPQDWAVDDLPLLNKQAPLPWRQLSKRVA